MADDSPIVFFDLSWLAVRAAPAEAIIEALNLSDPVPATWRQGINATAGDYWDIDATPQAYLSRVFITPEVAGWRLAVGGWLGGSDRDQPGRDVAGYCRRLSRDFGEAHAFTSQGRMDWYSWCVARAGIIIRHFLWADSLLVDEGTLSPAEVKARAERAKPPSGWRPSEGTVMAIAAECSVSPLDLESLWSRGTGCLAVTASGRQHGVPTRSLDDEASA